MFNKRFKWFKRFIKLTGWYGDLNFVNTRNQSIFTDIELFIIYFKP